MDGVKVRFSDLVRQFSVMENAIQQNVSGQIAFWATQRPVVSPVLAAWDGDVQLMLGTIAGQQIICPSVCDEDLPDQLVGLVTSRHPAVHIVSPILDPSNWHEGIWVDVRDPLSAGTLVAHVHWVPTVHLMEAVASADPS